MVAGSEVVGASNVVNELTDQRSAKTANAAVLIGQALALKPALL